MGKIPLKYTGEIQPPRGGEWNEQVNRKLYPYYSDEGLIEAVNLAIQLNRPLLLEGEPGCGKSELARAVFYEFSQRKQEDWHFRLWNIQSTSKAEDGFYIYDYIGRLQATQLAQLEKSNIPNPEDYLEFGALGHAFLEHGEENQECCQIKTRNIVLIDEIDKADTDFPNDLLLSIEDQCFEIKDIRPRRWLQANKDAPPIIFITSNQEKELPTAFLRRCLYHYVQFPQKEDLIKIINGRFKQTPQELVLAAIERFLNLREEMDENKEETDKKVSTSELIDWFTALDIDIKSKNQDVDKLTQELEKGKLPNSSTLLKNRRDREDYGQK